MRKIREVLRLRLGEELSLRLVSASLKIPLTTVGDLVRRAEDAGLKWPLPPELDDEALDALLYKKIEPPAGPRPLPDWKEVNKELHRPGVTLMLLWLEYRETYPDGYAYSQFCEHYRSWQRRVDVVMRQEHKAGEKLFVDFPGDRLPIYDERTGEIDFEAEIFVAVLGASSFVHAGAIRSQQLDDWVIAHVRTFEALGGCPAIVVCDNLRSGVTRSHRYEPDVNATYEDMAAHYGVAIIPARAYKPRDKAKVEAGVLLVERWILARLRKVRFTSLAEANIEIARLVAWVNARPFKKLDGSRQSLFEEIDRPALRPLPAERYETAHFKPAKANIDYHVEVGHHYYSVPYVYVGEVLDTRTTSSAVEVFRRGKRVASHVRSRKPGYSTDPAHMPESHRRHAEWTPSRIIEWCAKTGPSTASLAGEIMAARRHPEQGFRSCIGIIRLGERYGAERLENACARANSVKAHSYRSVESILKTGLDQKPLPGPQTGRTHPEHANLHGPGYYDGREERPNAQQPDD
jgi:transposase